MINISGANNIILVDSDALIGLIHETDAMHERCMKIIKFIAQENFAIIVPYAIVLEAATTFSRGYKIKKPDLALKALNYYLATEDIPYNDHVAENVAKLYDPKTSNKNTPFDHYVLALAKKNKISCVFSFDSFYKKHGLILIEDLIKQKTQ